MSTPQRLCRENTRLFISDLSHTRCGWQLGIHSCPRLLNGGGLSRHGRREGLREQTPGPFTLAEPRTRTLSSRTVPEVGKIQQHFHHVFRKWQRRGKGSPSPISVEIACWVLCRCGLRGVNPLCTTSCHCSPAESQTPCLQLAGHCTVCESQRLLLSQVVMLLDGGRPSFSMAHFIWGVVILLSVYRAGTGWTFHFQMLTKLPLGARHCSQCFESEK